MKEVEYPHRNAVVVQPSDPSGRWYVEFYIWHLDKQKLIRKRLYGGFDKHLTKERKMAYGKDNCRRINKELKYCTIRDKKTKSQQEYTPLPDKISINQALDEFIRLKPNVRDHEKNKSTFKSVCANFKEYCDNNRFPTHDITRITRQHTQGYTDSLVELKLSGKTIENKISLLHSVFNFCKKREHIKNNPFADLDKPKVLTSNKNESYTPQEQQTIIEYLKKNDTYLLSAVQILYYTFIRPEEMRMIRLEHIDLVTQKIYLPGANTKNSKFGFVSVPDPLIDIFKQMKLDTYTQTHYLFTLQQTPGKKPVYDQYFYNRYKLMHEALKLPQNKTFYSWKHTGVVAAYKAGVDIKAIQLQCRHSSISQTDTYLKSLGLIDNESFRVGIPSL